MIPKPILACIAALLPLAAAPRAARACGAATVSKGTISVSAQRIFLSVRGGTTDIVVQVVVPQSPAEYGALIPLPGTPVVDSQPVPATELDDLDRATQIDIVEPSSGGGCGCGGADSDSRSGAVVIGTVNIGPVTATTLSGESAAAVTGWLTDRGFVIPADQRSLVETYSGPGRTFVAIARNGATVNAPDSIGVHFTLDGDQRALPLRFARIGAASRIAFTVFVAAAPPAGPALPFTALTVNYLDPEMAMTSYTDALAAAVAARGSLAFVAEYRSPISPASYFLGAKLRTLVADGQTLTRYTTVLDAARLGTDADFTGAAPAVVPTVIGAAGPPAPARRVAGLPAALLLVAAVLALRRRA